MDAAFWSVPLLCLAVTGALCTWGIFSRHFDDSFLQRVGLAGLSVFCFLRLYTRLKSPDIPPPALEILGVQVSLAIYGVGTAIKLVKRSRHANSRERRGVGF